MIIHFYDEPILAPYARLHIEEGRCWIGKYRGQTRIYIPKKVGLKIGEGRIKALIEQIFPMDLLNGSNAMINVGPDCVHLELPSVLKEGEQDQHADSLVELIVNESK